MLKPGKAKGEEKTKGREEKGREREERDANREGIIKAKERERRGEEVKRAEKR